MTSIIKSSGEFQCPEHGCGATYKRKEYLTRHMATHQAGTHACPYCNSTFIRKDSVRRHVKLHHRDKSLNRVRAPAACLHCKARKTRCEGTLPCTFCLEKGLRCVYDNKVDGHEVSTEEDGGGGGGQWSEDISCHVEAYFRHFHPTWPILHMASFCADKEVPLLVQAVVMIGLWAGGERSARRAALDLHGKLMASIEAQRDKWDVSNTEVAEDDNSAWPMGTYQGILLSIIFATMTRSALSPQRITEPEYEVLVALIRSCKKRGMFNYPRMLAKYNQSGLNRKTALYVWVGVEEAKRFALSVYQVWNMYRNTEIVGNHVEDLLTRDDLQFPMPAGECLWESESKDQLVQRIMEAVESGNPPCEHEGEWICFGRSI